MGAQRRLVIRADDILVVGEYELSAEILKAIVEPDKRVLWAFVKAEDGRAVQPVAYNEDRVIWLTEQDIQRNKKEVSDLCSE